MTDFVLEIASTRGDLNSDLQFGPVDSTTIGDVERELGAPFPIEYRHYIENYAGGLLLGWEMYGIQTERSFFPSDLEISGSAIIDIVDTNRRMGNPNGTIEFACDGGGFHFAFMPQVDTDAVFVRGYGADWATLCPTFREMLERIALGTIQYPPP